jgi:hypothetical protein
LLLQLTDDGRQVDKLRLHRLHFRFDLVHLPRETLRAAVRANPYGFRFLAGWIAVSAFAALGDNGVTPL